MKCFIAGIIASLIEEGIGFISLKIAEKIMSNILISSAAQIIKYEAEMSALIDPHCFIDGDIFL
jgi:hypothetical protein